MHGPPTSASRARWSAEAAGAIAQGPPSPMVAVADTPEVAQSGDGPCIGRNYHGFSMGPSTGNT